MPQTTDLKRNRTQLGFFSFFRNKQSIYSELYRNAIGFVNILYLSSKVAKRLLTVNNGRVWQNKLPLTPIFRFGTIP
jgi:hypothetical protein